MDDILTLAQIQTQFLSEWILIESPQTNDVLEVQGGRVRWYSEDRDEVYRHSVALHPEPLAIFYTQPMPEDRAIIV